MRSIPRLVLLNVALVTVVLASAACADNPPPFVRAWGSQGSADGQFDGPSSVAVDSQGNVYVVDSGNARVQKFDSTGNFLLKWGSYGKTSGQFRTPAGIAVDASGDVYVADSGNRRIQKFDGSGNFLLQWGSLGYDPGQFAAMGGVAIDHQGAVYVLDLYYGNGRIQKFDSGGAFLLYWQPNAPTPNSPVDIAVGSSDLVYESDQGHDWIEVRNSQGAYQFTWTLHLGGPLARIIHEG
jgi:DNA-binding beta-propeller fold protein YncE